MSAAQPAIDLHNRSCQHELAMEKRILTDRFSLRHGVSLHRILFTDAFKAYKYFKNPAADFSECMSRLAYKLMHNPQVEEEDAARAARAQPPKQNGYVRL